MKLIQTREIKEKGVPIGLTEYELLDEGFGGRYCNCIWHILLLSEHGLIDD